jgi:hypothetical protein
VQLNLRNLWPKSRKSGFERIDHLRKSRSTLLSESTVDSKSNHIGVILMEPTVAQLKSLYRQSQWLTNIAFAPIHIVRLDERTGNLFILAGIEETIELQINPTGELL